MMKVVAIIQARIGSVRLPGKTLMRINGKPLIEHVVLRVRQAKSIHQTIVATTDQPQDDAVANFLAQKGIEVFRGSEKDLLHRFYEAALKYRADLIVRVCGDQPLVDPAAIELTVAASSGSDFTYCKHLRGWPDGTGCEVISFPALQRAQDRCREPFEREHIQPFFLNHQALFSIKAVDAPAEIYCPELHLAVDVLEDFQKIASIYLQLGSSNIVSLPLVIERYKAGTLNLSSAAGT